MKCNCSEYKECGTCEHLEEIDALIEYKEALEVAKWNMFVINTDIDMELINDAIVEADEKLHERGYDI